MSDVDRGYEWRKTRSKVIKRDNGKCVGCGMSRAEHKERYDQDLEVHHKTPAHIFEDDDGTTYERFAHHPKNLVTLCNGCHKRASDHGQYALGIMPKPGVKRRYFDLKAFELSDTEFMEELLDRYEMYESGQEKVIEPEFTVEIDASEVANTIANELRKEQTGFDESGIAKRVADQIEQKLKRY